MSSSSVKFTDEKSSLTVPVVCVFAKHEVSSDMETSSNDVHFPVSETDSHVNTVVLQKLDSTR